MIRSLYEQQANDKEADFRGAFTTNPFGLDSQTFQFDPI